jgi:uncharacterized protein involved in exopolysaccharide biosynthesis
MVERAHMEASGEEPLTLRALRRRWWLMIVLAIVAVIGAVVLNESSPRDFRAEAQILVTPVAPNSEVFLAVPALRQTGDTARLVQTSVALVDSHEARVRTDKQLGATARDASIDVQAKGASNLIAVRATSEDAADAAQVANAFARNALTVRYEQLIEPLERAISQTRSQIKRFKSVTNDYTVSLRERLDVLRITQQGETDPQLSLAEPASVTSDRQGPPAWLLVVAAALGGAALGFGLILLLEAVRPRRAAPVPSPATAPAPA